jgi:hypothetical protein
MLSLIDLPLYISLDNDNDDNNNNGTGTVTVSIKDFVKSDTALIRRYFMQLIEDNPSRRSQHSTMAWLMETSTATMNDVHDNADALVLELIRQRVALLTGLTLHVVHAGMELQVVHYPKPNNVNNNNNNNNNNISIIRSTGAGHCMAHCDSLALSSQPCCHVVSGHSPCCTCRMATILYSLSDVDTMAVPCQGMRAVTYCHMCNPRCKTNTRISMNVKCKCKGFENKREIANKARTPAWKITPSIPSQRH